MVALAKKIDSAKLILLIPCYNPSIGWEDNFIMRVNDFVNVVTKDVKVVLINDGSTSDIGDGVAQVQKELGDTFVYIQQPSNKGKGAALKAGAALFDSDRYMFTDIDFPYTIESMKRVYAKLVGNSGVVIGYRNHTYYRSLGMLRIVVSKQLRRLNRLMTNLPTDDTQCGLKAFDRQGRDLLLACTTDRFLIDLELLLKAHNANVDIKTVSVELRDGIVFTKFDMSLIFKESMSFIKLILKYRFFVKFIQ